MSSVAVWTSSCCIHLSSSRLQPLLQGCFHAMRCSCNALECGNMHLLLQGPFFLGKDMSMVDCAFVPFVERAAASLAYYKGWHMRSSGSFPAVEQWFEALERRPSYLASRSDYYTHCHDLPPQLGGVHQAAHDCWWCLYSIAMQSACHAEQCSTLPLLFVARRARVSTIQPALALAMQSSMTNFVYCTISGLPPSQSKCMSHDIALAPQSHMQSSELGLCRLCDARRWPGSSRRD